MLHGIAQSMLLNLSKDFTATPRRTPLTIALPTCVALASMLHRWTREAVTTIETGITGAAKVVMMVMVIASSRPFDRRLNARTAHGACNQDSSVETSGFWRWDYP